MILTKEVFLDFIIKMCTESKWDEDFDELNQKKLTMLKRKLNLSDDMIKIEKGNVILNARPDVDLSLSLNMTKFGEVETNKNIVSMINYHFSLFLEKYISIAPNVFDGNLTTCSTERAILNKINYFTKQCVMNSHKEQMLKELKSLLKELLDILYHLPFKQYKDLTDSELENNFSLMFNTELEGDDLKLFYLRLDEVDYM